MDELIIFVITYNFSSSVLIEILIVFVTQLLGESMTKYYAR